MKIAKLCVDSQALQLDNPYQYPHSTGPQRLPNIDMVSWVVGGTFGIVIGLILPLVLIEVLFNVVTWVIHTYPSIVG